MMKKESFKTLSKAIFLGVVVIAIGLGVIFMTKKEVIQTDKAPKAIGTYSQAIKAGNTVYLSGQIPLVPSTMVLREGGIEAQVVQVFENLSAVAAAAGGSLANIVKLNVYLTNLNDFAVVNEVMARYIKEPYPARAAIGISALPKGALVEIEGVMVL